MDVAQEYGQTIPMLAESSHRGQDKPCSVCGLAKRHIMNRIARDLGYDVLATGHNLDDEAAVLFGNTLQPLLLSLMSELTLGYLDDVTLGGPIDVVAADVQTIVAVGEAMGMHLNCVKCELLATI